MSVCAFRCVFVAGVYLSPVVFEDDHAGLWVHPLQDQRLPVSVSIGNHRGHYGEQDMRLKSCHMNAKVLTAYWMQPQPREEKSS